MDVCVPERAHVVGQWKCLIILKQQQYFHQRWKNGTADLEEHSAGWKKSVKLSRPSAAEVGHHNVYINTLNFFKVNVEANAQVVHYAQTSEGMTTREQCAAASP